MTQDQRARAIGSSQSRMAQAQATADGVGIDLLMRAFFATGDEIADLVTIWPDQTVRVNENLHATPHDPPERGR